MNRNQRRIAHNARDVGGIGEDADADDAAGDDGDRIEEAELAAELRHAATMSPDINAGTASLDGLGMP